MIAGKKTIQTFIAGMLLIQGSASFALEGSASTAKPNIPNLTPILAPGQGGSSFIGSPGNYNVQNVTQDNTAAMKQVFKKLNQVQDQDRAYLQTVLTRMNNQIQDLVKLANSFTQLSQKSFTGVVPVQDYLDLVNQIRVKNSALIADISANTNISRDLLPSYQAAQIGNMQVTVPLPTNIDLSPLMNRVEAAREKIVSDMSSTKFGMIMANGNRQVAVTDALNPDLSGIPLLTEQQVKDYNDQIKFAYTPTRDTKGLMTADISLITSSVQEFANQFGEKQYLTFESMIGTDDQRQLSVREALQNLSNHFFQRSYLRKKYHQRIGTFHIQEYDLKFMRTDMFRVQPKNVISTLFKNQIAIEETDVMDAFNNARLWFHTLDHKTGEVFGSKEAILKQDGKDDKYASQDTGIFIRLNTFITKATGQQEVAEVLKMLVRLELADIREEQMAIAGDWDGVNKYHDIRFRSTPEMKDLTNKKMCTMDFTLDASLYANGGPCAKLGVTRQPTPPKQIGRSQAGVFSDLLNQIVNIEIGRQARAENLRKLIQANNDALSGGNHQEKVDDDNSMFQ